MWDNENDTIETVERSWQKVNPSLSNKNLLGPIVTLLYMYSTTMSQIAAIVAKATIVAKAAVHKEVQCKSPNSTQTTFETSNRYVQSYLSYDLFSAIEEGCLTSVRNLLLSYPDLDLNYHIKDITPLSLTLYKRHFDIFHLFMRHHEKTKNIDLNMSSKDHLGRVEPPVVTSCRMHFLEGVVTLVSQGADIDAADNMGHTALWVASRQQMPDLVQYLIANGASVNKMDKYNCTPLLAAFMYRVSSIILKTLIVHGSSLGGVGPYCPAEQSPLFWAAKHGNVEIIKLVLMAGVSPPQIRSVRMALQNSDIDEDIVELLDMESKTPHSLRHQCKCVLRSHIIKQSDGKNFLQSVDSLPLPSSLKHYLLLNR
ncbi:ankyrin repeat and SOCS box protein 8-like [Haliotis cracherodii]|uniref:ankyrin repeat and SOCS box protein 8-like n=1 Tax=Haliotis cracherodii TaxID=6455 RepID=UPI0039E75F67